MATYSQWNRHRRLTRVAWVCGPDVTLRGEVAAAYRKAMPGLGHAVWGGEVDWALWDCLLTYPSGPRLTLVFGAEKLPRRENLALLLEDGFDGAFTVFFSAENDFPRVSADGHSSRGEQPRSVLAPYMEPLRDSKHAQLIRCCAPTSDEAKAELVAQWWDGAGRNVGASLLARCRGDLGLARQAVSVAQLAGIEPSEGNIRLVLPVQEPDEYADFVIAGKIKDAMAAASLTDPDEAGRLIGLLSSRLSALALLGDAARKGENVSEVARRQGIDAYLVKILRSQCASYDARRVAKCRQALALAETAWHSGARTGILEAVAVLWPV